MKRSACLLILAALALTGAGPPEAKKPPAPRGMVPPATLATSPASRHTAQTTSRPADRSPNDPPVFALSDDKGCPNGSPCWIHQQALEPVSPQISESIGDTIAIDGDHALIATNVDPSHGVYFFERLNKSFEFTWLVAPPQPGLKFGDSLAIRDGQVLLGDPAPGAMATDPEAVWQYIYLGPANWGFDQKALFHEYLTLQKGRLSALALSAALTGPTYTRVMVVAAEHVTSANKTIGCDGEDDCGKVWLVKRMSMGGGWTTADSCGDGLPSCDSRFQSVVGFGHAVDISADAQWLVIGSPEEQNDKGAVYVAASPFNKESLLALPQPGKGKLGESVAITNQPEGGYAVVAGAPEAGSNGEAYIFALSNAGSLLSLTATGMTSGTQFGASVAIDGDVAVFGAPIVSGVESTVGEVHIYTRQDGTWTFTQMLSGSSKKFGTTVALSGKNLMVGAPDTGAKQSRVHIYRFGNALGEPCTAATQAACASEYCADGVCCDSACDGACESCVPGAEFEEFIIAGQCAPVPAGTPDPLCASGTACFDEKTQQAGKVCGESGACESLRYCEGMRCIEGSGCLESCSDNDDCVTDFECHDALCELRIDAVGCDGDHTLSFPDGSTVDCSPYYCQPEGQCASTCSSTADCLSGHQCSSAGRCVVADLPSTRFVDCAFHGHPRRPPSAPGGWVWLIAAALAAGRRRLTWAD